MNGKEREKERAMQIYFDSPRQYNRTACNPTKIKVNQGESR
jgi:hypothetical protein